MKAGRWKLVGALLGVLPAAWLVLFGAYYMPSTHKVFLAGTDVKRMDREGAEGELQTRDVRFIVARDADTGETLMYRNEDTRWGWPPYFKFNSGDIAGDAANIRDTQPKATVLVTYYGWRFPMLDMYPNVVDLEIVAPDSTHVPVFNIVFVVLLVGTAGFAWFRVRRTWRRFRARRAAKAEPALADTAAAVAAPVAASPTETGPVEAGPVGSGSSSSSS